MPPGGSVLRTIALTIITMVPWFLPRPASGQCAGPPAVCESAILEVVSCQRLEEFADEITHALSGGHFRYPTEDDGAPWRVPTADEVIRASNAVIVRAKKVDRFRAFPCGQHGWRDRDTRWQKPEGEVQRFLLLGRSDCDAFDTARGAEVGTIAAVIGSWGCGDAIGSGPPHVSEVLPIPVIRYEGDNDDDLDVGVDRNGVRIPPVDAAFVLGKSDAPVVVSAFSALPCSKHRDGLPFDVRRWQAEDTVEQLLTKFPNEIQIYHRSYIGRRGLDFPDHVESHANLVVRAILAAARQGKHRALMARLPLFPEWRGYEEQDLEKIAMDLRLDLDRYRINLNEPEGQFVRDHLWDEAFIGLDADVRRAFPTPVTQDLLSATALVAGAWQGKLREMRRWIGAHCDDLSEAILAQAAGELKLDLKKFGQG